MKVIQQIILCLCCIIVFLFHCTVDVADGTGHEWEAKVCGVLQDKNGDGIDSVIVRLYPDTYSPVSDSGSRDINRDDTLHLFTTMTVNNGEFVFPSIKNEDSYVLSGMISYPDTFFAYYPDIVIDEENITDGDTINLGIVIPKEPAHVIYHVPNHLFDTTGVLYIPGTEFKQKVDSSRVVSLGVPASTIDVHYTVRDSVGTLTDTTIAHNITLSENEGIIIGAPIPAPVFIGPDTVVVDSPFTYTIQNYSDTLSYRMVWEDDDTTSWTNDSLFTHTWENTGSTTIFAQACLRTDVTKQSAWSSGKDVIIKPVHTISKPGKPWTASDTIWISDTTLFSTSGAVSNYNHPLHYQFSWGDSILSPWSADTTVSYSWPLETTVHVAVRARSSIDTAVISVWSDSLQIVVIPMDTVPPVITIVGANPFQLILGTSYIEPGVTAWDNVDGDLTHAIQTTGFIDSTVPGSYEKTYTVSDRAGNIAQKIRGVIVIDTTIPDTIPPVITLQGANPMNVLINTSYIEPGATAVDNFDGDITSSILITGTVDTSTAGIYTRTYNVSDNAGNASIEVVRTVNIIDTTIPDTTRPVITLLGPNPINLTTGFPYNEYGATATDNVDGDITSKIQITGTVNTSVVGTYFRTYTVSDSAENQAQEQRTIHVVDSIPPVITLIGLNPINLNVGDPYIEPGATATDNVDGDISHRIQISGVVDTSVAGNYTRNYSVSDDAGNNSAITRDVTVTDSTGRLNSIYENLVNRNGYNSIRVFLPSGKDTEQGNNSHTIQMIEPINTNKAVGKTE